MNDIFVGIIILAILAGAVYKIYSDKKDNVKCSGCATCPYKINGTAHKPRNSIS